MRLACLQGLNEAKTRAEEEVEDLRMQLQGSSAMVIMERKKGKKVWCSSLIASIIALHSKAACA